MTKHDLEILSDVALCQNNKSHYPSTWPLLRQTHASAMAPIPWKSYQETERKEFDSQSKNNFHA